MNTIEVEISHGKIRGVREEGVNIFKGIPYAGRISGDRRFRRPAALVPWSGVRDALRLGAPAIQPSQAKRTGTGRGLPVPQYLDACQ